MRFRSITLILLLLLASGGCRFWGVRGSGDLQKEVRDIEKFTVLDVSGAFDVEIVVGSAPSLTIEADDNLLKYIRTRVRGDKLIIDSKKDLSPRKGINIKITTYELYKIESSGASNIYATGIDSDKFRVDLSGAGNINLEGTATYLNVDISGAANLEAKDLISEHVKADLSGASNAIVFASKSIDADISGVGNINFYGDPEDVTTDISGVGSINRK